MINVKSQGKKPTKKFVNSLILIIFNSLVLIYCI